MPGPQGQKRPADVIGNVVRVMRIATGDAEEEYDTSDEGKDQAAAALGRKGGKARAAKMTPEQRAEAARNAAAATLGPRATFFAIAGFLY
jgi:hypothetical protein